MEKFCRINCDAYVKDMCAVQPSTACPTPSPTTTSTPPPTPAPTTCPTPSQFISFPQELAVELLESLVIVSLM
uniref:ShKT domain-containing protein n=1 Tax=Strongyloides papillosus TaxID=174720 RepID=A0A0N5CFA2_STREA